MPRQARIDIRGHLYHVMARGIERRRIFIDQRDYEDFLSRLEKALEIGKVSPEELVKQVICEAVIRMESLVEKDMELARRIEHMRNNLIKRGKKKYLITVA